MGARGSPPGWQAGGIVLAGLLVLGGGVECAPPPFAFGPETLVDVSPLSIPDIPKVASFPDGGSVVVWTVTPRTPPGFVAIHARLFGADGAPRTGEFLLVPHSGSNQVAEAVLARTDGTFIVIYRRAEGAPGARLYDHLFAARFDRRGTLLGEFRVSTRGPYDRESAFLAATNDGGIVVAWSSEALSAPGIPVHLDAVLRRFDANGKPLSSEITIARGAAYEDAYVRGIVVQADGTLVVLVLRVGDGVFAFLAHRSADGRRELGEDHTYLSDDGYEIAPFLARSGNGTLLVAWTWWGVDSKATPPTWKGPGNYYGPYAGAFARRFGPDLRPLGGPFQVNKYAPGEQDVSAICVQPAGGFVVAWTDSSGRDGDVDGVYGRSFSRAGVATSNDQRLSKTGAGSASAAQLACVAAKGAIAVWPWHQPPGYHVFRRALTTP